MVFLWTISNFHLFSSSSLIHSHLWELYQYERMTVEFYTQREVLIVFLLFQFNSRKSAFCPYLASTDSFENNIRLVTNLSAQKTAKHLTLGSRRAGIEKFASLG